MARIAYAWELGGGLGHAVGCLGIARAMAPRGHEAAFIFRDPAALPTITPESHPVFRSPRHPDEGVGRGISYTFAEILLGVGYETPGTLRPLVQGWLDVLEASGAQALVEDFAPTALLAARIKGLRRVRMGNGFCVPPRTTPLPAFRYDAVVPDAQVAAAEAQALASVNAVLAEHGAPPLAALADLFEADEDFLCTFPELDAYGNRPTAGYWGPRGQLDLGEPVDWPRGQGACILAYVRRDSLTIDAIIDALATRRCRVVLYAEGLQPERRARLEGPGRHVATGPVRIDRLLPGCDLLVSHGGQLAPSALLLGVPQLVFPEQYEQYLTGRRMEQLGAGALLAPQARRPAIEDQVDRMLREPRFREAAQAFARKYRGFSAAEQRRRIVERLAGIVEA